MPRLSIVIPWAGPAGPFEDTLAAVLQNRPAGCEILIALAQPYDDPYRLGGEVTFLPPSGKSDFVSLTNRGIAASSAAVVQVLACGQIVREGWTSAPLVHFDDASVAAVAPVLVSANDPARVLAAGLDFSPGGARRLAERGRKHDVAALLASRPLAATMAGGFFRRSVIDALGGFDVSLGAFAADLDYGLCAAELGLRVEREPTSLIATPAQCIASDGSLAAGRGMEQLYWRHLSKDERRANRLSHYALLAGELAFALAQPWWFGHAVGRTLGRIGAAFDHPQAERIATAQQRLAEATRPQILAFPGATAAGAYRRAA